MNETSTAVDGRTNALQRWLPRAAPLALVVVAVMQIALTRSDALNPWKGGGFGMFATLDSGSARRVYVYRRRVTGAEDELPLPRETEALALRARQLPSDANMRALAQWLLEAAGHGGLLGPRPLALRVEVVRRVPDFETRTMRWDLLRKLEVPGR